MKHKAIYITGILIILTAWFTILAMNPEQHFKITKEGVEVDAIEIYKSCSSENWDDPDFPVDICSQLYPKKISKRDLTPEWLEENCFKEDASNNYVCEEYLVEMWNQIK